MYFQACRPRGQYMWDVLKLDYAALDDVRSVHRPTAWFSPLKWTVTQLRLCSKPSDNPLPIYLQPETWQVGLVEDPGGVFRTPTPHPCPWCLIETVLEPPNVTLYHLLLDTASLLPLVSSLFPQHASSSQSLTCPGALFFCTSPPCLTNRDAMRTSSLVWPSQNCGFLSSWDTQWQLQFIHTLLKRFSAAVFEGSE